MSLNETNARARVPSGLRYLARFSVRRCGGSCGGGGGGGVFCRLSLSLFFLGEEWKKLRIPLLFDDDEEGFATIGGGRGGAGGTIALN